MRAALMAAVALAGLAACAGKARADLFSGDQLLTLCESADPYERGTCYGVIAGASDMLGGVSARGGNYAGFRACQPPSITAGQALDVVVKFLRAHPADRRLAAVSVAAKALAEEFPCPKWPLRRP